MFLSKSPFYHIYVTVSHKITHSTKADMLTHMFYLDTPVFTAYYARVLHANPNIDDNDIHHRKKRPLNLVLISHKYSQRNSNLEITFCHRCENFVSLQSEGSQYHTKHQKRYVSPWVYSRRTFYHITSWLHKGSTSKS